MALTLKLAKGDTLGQLAYYLDMTVAQIMALNPAITNPNVVYAGQTIFLPDNTVVRKFLAARNLATTYQIPPRNDITSLPSLNLPAIPAPPPGTMDIAVSGGGLKTGDLFSNPWVLGGIAVIVIALLMGKKGK